MPKHIQITFGHAGPVRGWEVHLDYLEGQVISCANRDEAEKIYNAIISAYKLGKNDLRDDLNSLLKKD